jgi:type II secretory pathway pseudopilin PulG
MRLPAPQPGTGKRGFTLLELLLYVGLVGFILTAATALAFEFVLSRVKTLALEEASRNARFAVARVATEIREASDVNLGSSTFGSHPSTLSLATANGATNPTIFAVSGSALTIQQGAGSALPLTSPKVQVSEFIVTNLSTTGKTKAFRIHLRLNYANPSSLQMFNADYTFETTALIHKNDGFAN